MEELGFWQFSREIVWPGLSQGLVLTVELTLWSGFLGVLLGLGLGLARLARNRFINIPARIYVAFFRGTPLLLQILFIYFALPQLVDIRLEAMPAGILGLSLNAGAYLAEIFRAAIESIDKGQMEAARTLGMSYSMAMRRIILPQTTRRLIPPVVNELSALAKDTSLVSTLALGELLYMTQRIGARYLRPWEVYVWAALGYLAIVLTLATLARHLELRLIRKDA